MANRIEKIIIAKRLEKNICEICKKNIPEYLFLNTEKKFICESCFHKIKKTRKIKLVSSESLGILPIKERLHLPLDAGKKKFYNFGKMKKRSKVVDKVNPEEIIWDSLSASLEKESAVFTGYRKTNGGEYKIYKSQNFVFVRSNLDTLLWVEDHSGKIIFYD